MRLAWAQQKAYLKEREKEEGERKEERRGDKRGGTERTHQLNLDPPGCFYHALSEATNYLP